MRYQTLKVIPLGAKTRYVIDLDLAEGETLEVNDLINDLQNTTNGAPFGYNVESLPNGWTQIDVFKD